MAANRVGVITVKGGVTRDYLVSGQTQVGKNLRKARKSNNRVENLTLDLEMKAIEVAMRNK